ncbi:hypothetical protein EIP86_003451 [Pleurotus ostreatoroseus]|nr:hypothetical protein EIP86_003451 [Pleurotus ostreatoroseus]
MPRPDQAVRKRPKYTRSKTGCLTCRAKKVKCDEAKPDCTRCQQGQRECKWPEGIPTRKKPAAKKDSAASESPVYDNRPSTACSSVSDLSTPPTRNHTPPKQEPLDVGLPPMVSRRHRYVKRPTSRRISPSASSDQLMQVPMAVKVDDAARLHQ